MLKLVNIVLLFLLVWFTHSLAGEYSGPNRDAEGNIVPTPKGEACIAPVAEMRREHMNMLLHKRDQTMREGIRTKKASLTECINCHVTPDASGNVARIDNKQHFCASCHVAASVSIDCFSCHADRPASMFSQQVSE
ncbi:MAG: Hdr-like menaquinol oxidoreductase cytochrome c subunit [Gammaproteobacteria bacterium]|nr:Hdr-like menaquinol oxidoreductase cytochrome c subunit [Gammaproteobacteria bacterium]